jgi:hypothetical protein
MFGQGSRQTWTIDGGSRVILPKAFKEEKLEILPHGRKSASAGARTQARIRQALQISINVFSVSRF